MMRDEGGGKAQLLSHFIHRRRRVPACQDDLEARRVAHQPKDFGQFHHHIIANPKAPAHGIIAPVPDATWRRGLGLGKAKPMKGLDGGGRRSKIIHRISL